MGIQINGQTDTVTSTTAGGSVTVTPLAASSGLNVGTGASISSPATNVLTLGTNNTEALRITGIGSVGIGTTNPTTTLQVNGTTKVETSIGSTQAVWFTTLDSKNYSASNVSLLVQPEKAYFHDSSLTVGKSYEPVIVSAALTTNNGSNLAGLFGFQNLTNIAGTSSAARLQAFGFYNAVYRNSTTDISSYASNALYGQVNNVVQGSNVDQSAVTGAIFNSSNAVGIQKGTATAVYGNYQGINVGAITNYSASSTNVYNFYAINTIGATSGTGIGTVTNLYSYYAQPTIRLTAQVSNYYGLYLAGPTVTGTLSNRYSIYSADASSPMYHAGSIGIGITNPSVPLHIARSDSEAQRLSASGANQGIWVSYTAGSPNVADLKVGVDGAAGGTYVGGSSAFVWNVGNSPLAFGTNNTERLRIDSSGRVNINTQTSYTYGLLTVQGQNATNAGSVNGLYVRGDGNANSCPIYFNDEFGYPQKSIYQEAYYLKIRGHNNEGVWILGSNAATNPSTNYKFNGTNNGSQCFNASNTTTWNTTSDQRIKENIEDLTNALDKIKQIRPVTFDYTDEYAEHRSWNICDENDEKIGINTCMKHHNVGYIAQEYKEVFPNDVTVGPEDIGDIHYEDFHQLQPNSVVPYLVKAVQELSAEVESLKAKIASAGL